MQPIREKASTIRLSVVIVTFNNIADAPKCIESLSNVPRNFWLQLIIVDNASRDGTKEYLLRCKTRLKGTFARIDLIFNARNVGFTRALNQGAMRSAGDYVLILNPDVSFPPETIPTLVACLDREPRVGVVAPQLRYPNGRIQPSCRRFPQHRDVLYHLLGLNVLFPGSSRFNGWHMGDFDHCSSKDVDQPQGAFLLVKSEVLRTVGFFDERFAMFFSDVDWCYRVRQAGWKIRFCAQAFAYHKKGASVYRRRPQMIISSHRSFVQYFARYDRTAMDQLLTRMIYFLLLVFTLPRLLAAYLNKRI